MYNKLELNPTFKKYKDIINSSSKKTSAMPNINYSSFPGRISNVPNWESNAKTIIVQNFEKMTSDLNKLNELNDVLKSQTDLIYGDLKNSLDNLEKLINQYNHNVDLYNQALYEETIDTTQVS